MIEKLLNKRNELVLKHEFLCEQLRIQSHFANKETVKKTKSAIRRVESNYDNLREQIYDYFYSLSEEEMDEIIFPNPENISDLHGTVETKAKENKVVKGNKADKKLLNEVAKEINSLF